jgi:hypothetical protein
VLVVGHHGDRADAHVTDLEAADPRRFAEPILSNTVIAIPV